MLKQFIETFVLLAVMFTCCVYVLMEGTRGDKCTWANKIELDFKIPPDTTHLKTATTYNTEISQCDNTPNHTADGSYIDPIKLKNGEIRWVALSRDLIWDDYRQTIFKDTTHWRGQWKFGDTLEVYSKKFPHLNGDWVVHDCKSSSFSMSIDFLIHPLNNRPKLGVGRDVKLISRSEYD